MRKNAVCPLTIKVWFGPLIGITLLAYLLAEINILTQWVGPASLVFLIMEAFGFLAYLILPSSMRVVALLSLVAFPLSLNWLFSIDFLYDEYISAIFGMISTSVLVGTIGKLTDLFSN